MGIRVCYAEEIKWEAIHEINSKIEYRFSQQAGKRFSFVKGTKELSELEQLKVRAPLEK
ncbi:hypothetical protein [Peribacillus muralis]|uniref:hypothetical protein n=1 Tax=Peribacillus muralis TaxID=264697 RepID=UPI003D058FB2